MRSQSQKFRQGLSAYLIAGGAPRAVAFSSEGGGKANIPHDGIAVYPGAGERSRTSRRSCRPRRCDCGRAQTLVDVPKFRGVGCQTLVDKARRGIVEQAARDFNAAVHAVALDFDTNLPQPVHPPQSRRVSTGVVPGAPGAI